MRSLAILTLAAACTGTATPPKDESADSGTTVDAPGVCGAVVPGDPRDSCCTVIGCTCDVDVLCDAGGCGTLAERLAETPPDPNTCQGESPWSGGTFHLQCTLDGAVVDVLQRFSAYYTSESWVYAADGSLVRASFGSDVNELCDDHSATLSFGPETVDLTDCCEVRDPTVTAPATTTTATCSYAACPAR
jgi:hypothetical protein